MSVNVIHERCDLEKDNNNKLPYTAYVIQYEVEGNLVHDIAMAQKAVAVSYTHLTLPTKRIV